MAFCCPQAVLAFIPMRERNAITIIMYRCSCLFIFRWLFYQMSYYHATMSFPKIISSTRYINRGSMVGPSLILLGCRRVFIPFICITLLSRRIACRLSFNYYFATPPQNTIQHTRQSIYLILKQMENRRKSVVFRCKSTVNALINNVLGLA